MLTESEMGFGRPTPELGKSEQTGAFAHVQRVLPNTHARTPLNGTTSRHSPFKKCVPAQLSFDCGQKSYAPPGQLLAAVIPLQDPAFGGGVWRLALLPSWGRLSHVWKAPSNLFPYPGMQRNLNKALDQDGAGLLQPTWPLLPQEALAGSGSEAGCDQSLQGKRWGF